MRCALAILVLALIGCGAPAVPSGTPVALRPGLPPPASPVPSPGWQLTTVVTAIDAPPGCRVADRVVGFRRTYPLFIGRDASTGSLQFILNMPLYPTDHDGDYAGTVDGGRFTVKGHFYEVTTPCVGEPLKDPRFTPEYDAEVSGEFAEDGRALSATEVQTYRLQSGEPVVYHLSWRAPSASAAASSGRR